MKKFLLLVFLLIVSNVSFANTGKDGSFWRIFSDDDASEKITFLLGITDTQLFYLFLDKGQEGSEIRELSPNFTLLREVDDYEMIVKALDQFYENYKNEKIPVFFAIRIIQDEQGGLSSDELTKKRQAIFKFMDETGRKIKKANVEAMK